MAAPTASAGSDQIIQIPCSGSSFSDVILSGTSDTSGVEYTWIVNDGWFYGNPHTSNLPVGSHDIGLFTTNYNSYTSAGILTSADEYDINSTQYSISVDVDKNLLFVGTGFGGIKTFLYTTDGVLTSADGYTTGGSLYSVFVDSDKNLLFVGESNQNGIRTFLYTSAGILTSADWYNTGSSSYSVSVDADENLLFIGGGSIGIYTFLYTSAGILTSADEYNTDGSSFSVSVDADKNILFVGDYTTGVKTFLYTSAGILTSADEYNTDGSSFSVSVDADKNLLFVGDYATGVKTFLYSSAGILTSADEYNTDGISYAVSVDINKNVLFVCDGSESIKTFLYTPLGVLTSACDYFIDTDSYSVSIDSDKNLLFVGDKPGSGIKDYYTGIKSFLYAYPSIISSPIDYTTITINDSPGSIDRFDVTPNGFVTSSEGESYLYWNTTEVTSAYIDNDIGWVSANGSTILSASGGFLYNLSAYNTSGCLKTASTYALVNMTELSACNLKEFYVKLFGPETVRYGTCNEINLTGYLPENLSETDTNALVQLFQDYLNQMYDGDCGYTLSSSEIGVNICQASGCGLSAVDNDYEFNSYTSAGISANDELSPSNDVASVYISNFCKVPTNKISILEKTKRINELFDPDLIPIELIQFYAENLGYNVGLSRDNVGIDFKDSSEEINQKKYLRFMIRNLPEWYKIKTTHNAAKMMMYSFGLIGDFVFYYTKDYIDPNTAINTTNSQFGEFIIQDSMSYREIQEIKCNLAQWEEFKENRKKYLEVLKSLQFGKNNWKLTDVDTTSTKEDITNIPDDFFSTPHFRLYYELEESIGNLSTDLNKQNLIGRAILSIKPINNIYEGVTAHFTRNVTMYMLPYSRITKHIKMYSDGYADWWT